MPQETDYGESAVLTLELEDEDRVVDYFCRSEAKRAYKRGELERGQNLLLGVQTEVQEVNGPSTTHTNYPFSTTNTCPAGSSDSGLIG